MNDNRFKFSPSVLAWPLYFVVFLWIIYWIDIKFPVNFAQYGVYPRTFKGLRGVLFSPFIHGSLEHLYNNSIPLLVLIAALRFFYRRHALQVIGYGILLSGAITWLIGRESYHIGASGLIYVLVSFMFFKGIQTGYYRLVALSLTIIMLYGGMIWYVFPDIDKGISWEGHLAGLITGFIFSRLYDAPDYQKPIVYDWQKPNFNPEDDPFMKRFDENGNFVNPPPPEPEPEEESIQPTSSTMPRVSIVYTYTKNSKEEDNEGAEI
ncbi:rhomboid family intramembrane serine protease [Flavobacterium arcticum]|uniref:Rhomboid family intramembrane serine protease n=1 Tax=Flavobacterium arcticum TaxID=1784713 RepID=A0A345H9F9_9FLAO|nr:rhomboid family intramembrane serine protease [Flavobacterium arcticum]AXG73219.1 rhomboid family intramembrane serine protease [Flavobacterium arcticum]KAF2513012.1 rhomboid family intramembrane serine protease [Flavobacterium arcticum]